MKAAEIINKYISFFEEQGHTRIAQSSLVPQNDPTTLFTSSGMQPLVPYLLGETHPAGTRLVDVQNCFRAPDIEEIGDNRHTTFFRMLGNWSLGDYFKKEQLPWIFTFITKELQIDPKRLYVTVFEGEGQVPKDEESVKIWKTLFASVGIDVETEERIFYYGAKKNWWSRSGTPEQMPVGEPGGPSSELFYDFGADLKIHEGSLFKNERCHLNCDCGRFIEIGNNVFMTYKKQADGSLQLLPKPNVDFGGGMERLLAAAEHQPDVFQTSLLKPIIETIVTTTKKTYVDHARHMRVVADHFLAATFISADGVTPSNKEQGYILRRLIRRGFDHFSELQGKDLSPVIEAIVEQYKETDPELVEKFENIKYVILEEVKRYSDVLQKAKRVLEINVKNTVKTRDAVGGEIMGVKGISSEQAFTIYTSYGLSPTQIKSLGYTFDDQAFADLMEKHQKLSRSGAEQKFKGGLADHQERTVMGHTATHLLQQALRDVLGDHVHQTGSNITTERLRFDFSHEEKLTEEQIKQAEAIVNEKIKENLPVHFEMLPLKTAKEIGAIGLFDEKYEEKVKVYFIGGSGREGDHAAYSKEFCGGPHVDFTGKLKSFKIIKQENIGNKQRRVYAVVG
jgi:alanyl-tRNA synthetase